MTNAELWELFPIILVSYDLNWPRDYDREASALCRAMADDLFRIHHIGSTAVPGLTAKPTIDILMEITTEADPERMKKNVIATGYRLISKADDPEWMFTKGYTETGFVGRTYHLHVRRPGDWDELYFCDYLRDHPEACRDYEKLKTELKARFEHDRDAYTEGKTAFIKNISGLARVLNPKKYLFEPIRKTKTASAGPGPGNNES